MPLTACLPAVHWLAVLPLAAVASALVQFALMYTVLVPTALVMGAGVSVAWVALLPVVILQTAFTAGLVFLSFGKGKLPNYLVPLAPLAALVIAFELGQELVHPTRRRLAPGLLAATLVAVAVILGAGGALRLDGVVRAGVIAGSALYGVAALAAL